MTHTITTAPMPATPSPWYAIQPVTLINPNGVTDGWGILCEETGELVMRDEVPVPWLAESRACAMGMVKYLNAIDDLYPPCLCPIRD